MESKAATLAAVALLGASLTACAASGPKPEISRGASASASKGQPTLPAASGSVAQKVGKPYQVRGKWYTPAHQPRYDEVGEASWYGEAHQGRPTASGERFDMRLISAAHKTLPLPSLVEVTNLETGRSLAVRINDRGPFVDGRVIDLSKAAADRLGVRAKGVARVRVRYLGPGGAEIARTAPSRSGLSVPGYRTAADGGWIVQAGAFAEPDNADRAARTLRAAGRTAVREQAQDGRRLHRVLVGPWPHADEAQAALNRVVAMGFADARLLPAT